MYFKTWILAPNIKFPKWRLMMEVWCFENVFLLSGMALLRLFPKSWIVSSMRESLRNLYICIYPFFSFSLNCLIGKWFTDTISMGTCFLAVMWHSLTEVSKLSHNNIIEEKWYALRHSREWNIRKIYKECWWKIFSACGNMEEDAFRFYQCFARFHSSWVWNYF